MNALWLVLGVAVVAAGLAWRRRSDTGDGDGMNPGATSDPGAGGGGLIGIALPATEVSVIVRAAAEMGVDPRLLAALRKTENGGPQSVNPDYPASGNPFRAGEFGIQTIYAPTFEEQARIAARTVLNTMARYQNNVGADPTGPDGRLTPDFLRYFSQGGPGYGGYAPVSAHRMNAPHLANLVAFYNQIDVAVA